MHKRFGRRTDSNQSDVMYALRAIGCIVFDIEEPFDLLVDYEGEWHVFEVKNPETHARKKGGSKLTDVQDQILAKLSAKVHIVEHAAEAIECLRRTRYEGQIL